RVLQNPPVARRALPADGAFGAIGAETDRIGDLQVLAECTPIAKVESRTRIEVQAISADLTQIGKARLGENDLALPAELDSQAQRGIRRGGVCAGREQRQVTGAGVNGAFQAT